MTFGNFNDKLSDIINRLMRGVIFITVIALIGAVIAICLAENALITLMTLLVLLVAYIAVAISI